MNTQETKTVRISNATDKAWYAGRVGETFEVNYRNGVYDIAEDSGLDVVRYIDKADCEVVA